MRPAGVFVSGYCGGAGLVPSPGNNGTSKGSPEMAQKRRRARGVPPTWRKNDVGSEVFPRHGTETTSGATMIILADHQRSRKKIPAQPSGYSHKILKILFSFKNAFCFIEFCCHCFCNFC